jgi:hypothetical protein
MATVKAVGNTYTSNLQLSTDFQVTGLPVVVNHYDGEGDYIGYNRRYISDGGMYDVAAALEEFSKVSYGRRLAKAEIETFLANQVGVDSHESFIYNMLVTWYKAKLYKDTRGTDGILKVKQSPYKDSHVVIGYHNQTSEITHEIELGLPNPDAVEDIDLQFRKDANFWDRPFVLRYNGQARGQTEFYLFHVLGRTKESALNVDINIEPLDTSELLMDPVSAQEHTAIQVDNVPWTKPEILWMWITDYVRLNRVEHAFAAALELLGALSAQPMPSYQESNHWQYMLHKVTLAKFSPTRARIRSNLDGEPYVQDTQALEFMEKEAPHPKNFLLISAIVNYYSWVGLHALVDNYSRGLTDWSNVFQCTDEELSLLTTPMARAACVSAVTGKEFVTCANKAAHLVYDIYPMAEHLRVTFDEVLEDGYHSFVDLEGPHPYVSGSLVLGTVSGDMATTSHLKALQKFSVDKYGTTSVEGALTAMTAYRLFGHQLQVVHERSGEQYPVYANSRECVVAPTSLLDRTRDYDMLALTDATVRVGRNDNLPHPTTLRGHSDITLTISQPVLQAVSWQRRQQPLSVAMHLPGRRRSVTFKIRAGTAFQQVVMRAKAERATVPQGFQQRGNVTAPELPGPHTALADTTAGVTQQDLDAVDAAE